MGVNYEKGVSLWVCFTPEGVIQNGSIMYIYDMQHGVRCISLSFVFIGT